MVPALQPFVYILCFVASAVCAALLVRSYQASRTRLLLWAALCFVLLAVNNLIVVLDVLVISTMDLGPFRQAASLGAITVLLIGFVWDAD
jgi:hypothetical protein